MPASELKGTGQKNLPGIFISYRRSDTPDAVGRIYDRLVAEFGKARVFKDVDSIPLGQDFRGHLNDIVGGCAAVLAIIGPKWTDIRNEAGQKRLEDPDDFVRIELEAALARSVPVVPVLVGHAPMPGSSQLPSSLASLAFRQSIEVRPDPDFHNDATRLVSALWAIVDPHALQAKSPSAAHPRSPIWRWLWPAAFAAAAISAIAFAIPAMKHLRETPPPETRIAIDLHAENVNNFALSPDGRQIVYRASDDNQHRLWLRSLSATTAQPVPGTEGAANPFWSPDGRSIGFFASGALQRLDLGGGQPQTLTSVVVAVRNPNGGAWGANGDILFSSVNQPILRIASTGGAVTAVTKVAAKESGHFIFAVLPDGRHFLFLVVGGKSQGTYIGTLDGNPPVRLTADVGVVAYLPSGWMVWMPFDLNQGVAKGSLLAQRLDLRNARLTGEPVSIAGGVSDFSVSATGLIAYATTLVAAPLQLTWVDRSGKELSTIGEVDSTLSVPRVAPDGRHVAVSKVAQGNRDLWLLDGTRASRMTMDAKEDNSPVWSPDGLRITFMSDRSGNNSLYQKLASGVGGEERIQTPDEGAYPNGWSADGKYLSYNSAVANTVGISVLPTSGDRKPFTFLQSKFLQVRGQFSPDGRWVAYQSNESGKFEVFVRPFNPPGSAGSKDTSNVAATQWMVSTAGGVSPMWRPDGKEIFFLNPAGEMMAAPITVTGSALVPGNPVKLFDAHSLGGGSEDTPGRQYDVAPDGRFLINRVRDADASRTITLIQNWNPDARK
jgi:Tol biopolymer transport system component